MTFGLNFRNLFLFASLLLQMSCDQAVRFEQPQPAGVADMEKLPDRLRGSYYSEKDSSTLEITDDLIVVSNRALIRLALNDAGEGIRLYGDTVTDVATGYSEIGKVLGDSIEVHWPLWTDTLFRSSGNYLLRKFKSRYFLNRRLDDGTWEVFILDPYNGGSLMVEELLAPEDISMLEHITPVKQIETDTILGPRYEINPDRKALKKLMRRGFTARGIYRRVK